MKHTAAVLEFTLALIGGNNFNLRVKLSTNRSGIEMLGKLLGTENAEQANDLVQYLTVDQDIVGARVSARKNCRFLGIPLRDFMTLAPGTMPEDEEFLSLISGGSITDHNLVIMEAGEKVFPNGAIHCGFEAGHPHGIRLKVFTVNENKLGAVTIQFDGNAAGTHEWRRFLYHIGYWLSFRSENEYVPAIVNDRTLLRWHKELTDQLGFLNEIEGNAIAE